MPEELRNFETNLKEMRGFYVTKMKKDQATGNYFGVATWIPRNAPMPGARTSHSDRWSVALETSMQTPSISGNARNMETTPREAQQSESRYRAATNDDFSRAAAREKPQLRETIQKKSSFYDPYDSYEL